MVLRLNVFYKHMCYTYIYIYVCVCLLLYMQNNYCKLQPPLLMLKSVTHRFNHWNIFCRNELLGFFFFIILKEILYFDRL